MAGPTRTQDPAAMIPSLLEDMKIENLIRQENLPQICSAADRLRRHAQAAPQGFDPASLELLDGLLTAAAEAEQTLALQRARIRYLESLSVTDELTGLLNRRGFELELSRALARARRPGESGVLEHGRATWRERVWQYVVISVVAAAIK